MSNVAPQARVERDEVHSARVERDKVPSLVALYEYKVGMKILVGNQSSEYYLQPVSALNRSIFIQISINEIKDFHDLHFLKK